MSDKEKKRKRKIIPAQKGTTQKLFTVKPSDQVIPRNRPIRDDGAGNKTKIPIVTKPNPDGTE